MLFQLKTGSQYVRKETDCPPELQKYDQFRQSMDLTGTAIRSAGLQNSALGAERAGDEKFLKPITQQRLAEQIGLWGSAAGVYFTWKNGEFENGRMEKEGQMLVFEKKGFGSRSDEVHHMYIPKGAVLDAQILDSGALALMVYQPAQKGGKDGYQLIYAEILRSFDSSEVRPKDGIGAPKLSQEPAIYRPSFEGEPAYPYRRVVASTLPDEGSSFYNLKPVIIDTSKENEVVACDDARYVGRHANPGGQFYLLTKTFGEKLGF